MTELKKLVSLSQDVEVLAKLLMKFENTNNNEDDDNKDALYQTIEKKLNNYDRFWLEKELLLEVLKQERSFSFGRQRIEQYRKDCTFKELIKELDSQYDNYLDVTERADAPDFQLVTAEGEVKKLSDFKGRVVFINFWASWCRPCLDELPHSRDLAQKLAGQPIVFLYLSMDENDDIWQKTVKKQPFAANARHYRRGLSAAQPLLAQLLIYAIPHYLLLDKTGKIINRDATTPSQKATLKYIRKWLQK